MLLVDGKNRISGIIKYLTKSSWSHSVLYIGDELLRNESALARRMVDELGTTVAREALIEALPSGVTVSPLDKYIDCNLRIARPHKLSDAHLQTILDEAIASIGTQYDLGNLWSLARYMFPVTLVPQWVHNIALRLRAPADHEVICSSLLGRLFNRVSFPVLPKVEQQRKSSAMHREFGWLRQLVDRSNQYDYTGVFTMRNPDQLTPRDFDLSPYFETVKFNVIASGDFDYRRITWSQPDESGGDGGDAGDGDGSGDAGAVNN